MKMYKEFAKETWKKLDKKLSYTAIKSYDKIPYTSIIAQQRKKSN